MWKNHQTATLLGHEPDQTTEETCFTSVMKTIDHFMGIICDIFPDRGNPGKWLWHFGLRSTRSDITNGVESNEGLTLTCAVAHTNQSLGLWCIDCKVVGIPASLAQIETSAITHNFAPSLRAYHTRFVIEMYGSDYQICKTSRLCLTRHMWTPSRDNKTYHVYSGQTLYLDP